MKCWIKFQPKQKGSFKAMSVLLPVEGLDPSDPQTSSSLYQTFYSKFQRKISTKMKRGSKNPIRKTVSQKKQPKTTLPKTWVYTNHSNFPQELSGLYKLHIVFFLADYVDGYFRLSLGKYFFWGLSSQCLFFLGQGENIPGKKSLNKNSSKVRRNTSSQEHLSKT